jgi:trigger factor
MKTSLEDIGPVKKKLSIEIESQEVDRKLNETYRELKKRATIPGFRPGKVPRRLLERHFGHQVHEDVTSTLISETFPKAIEEAKTFPLGTPILEKGTLKQGQNFKYSAVMEVRPHFELKGYLGVEVEKEKYTVTEEQVRTRLDQIRKAHGKLTSISPDRPVQKDDYVVLDYEGFEEGTPIEGVKAPNLLLQVGKNDFHPKFEEALIGLRRGSEVEITVEFEPTYYHKKLAGKKVCFKVSVTDIKEMVLPELTDDFARDLGADFKHLEELKHKVKEAIIAEEEKRIDGEMKQRLLQVISEGVDFELPQVLVESEIDYAVEKIRQNLLRSGSSIETAGLSVEKIRRDFRPTSEKRVKEMLILGEIAQSENLMVEDEDLEKGFRDLASSTGQNSQTLRRYYEANNLLDSLKQRLLEEKTLNYLVEHATISEVDKISGDAHPSEE